MLCLNTWYPVRWGLFGKDSYAGSAVLLALSNSWPLIFFSCGTSRMYLIGII